MNIIAIKNKDKKFHIDNKYYVYFLTFTLSALLYTLTCLVTNIYPFGKTSNLIWDLNLQYMDFFAYLKRVLSGDVNFSYSFSKSLGGSLVATYGYYLASPFNWLVVFFEMENLQLFIYFISMLKIGMAGLTFDIFIRYRFPKLGNEYEIMLSIAYAFSQYMVGQVSNIMWLDGVYMLPLILLGVYKFVSLNRKSMLYLAVALSVIFNWYTGYMNCLFVPFYFLMEELLYEKKKGFVCIKSVLRKGTKLCTIEILGVMLSGVLFLPVVYGLLQGKGVTEGSIFEWVTNGRVLDIIRGFTIGNNVNTRQISLYCGVLIVVFCIAFLFNDRIELYEKVIISFVVLFCIAICFFRPMENIWNGFRIASSYFYRFSYITIFMLIFMAAFEISRIEGESAKIVISAILVILSGLFVLDNINAFDDKYLWISVSFIIIYGVLLCCKRHVAKRIILLFLFIELLINGRKVFLSVYTESADYYPEYVNNQMELINDVKNYDSEFYRIDETKKRTCSANLNESMSYGYNSISHYDSAYDMNVAEFLSSMGYANFLDFSLYDEPILPVDSLLGEKYLLSDKQYDGFRLIDNIEGKNDKKVYYNEYTLPLGYGVSENINNENSGNNPFERINSVYSNILGRDIQIFYPVKSDGMISDNKIEYYIPRSEGSHVILGCADTDIVNLDLYIDGDYRCNYQSWFTRYVFNIGNGNVDHNVCFSGFNGTLDNINTMLYYMDLKEFYNIIQEIKGRQCESLIIRDGYVVGDYMSESDGKIMLTIPYTKGWKATINEKEVSIEKGLDTFIVLNVEKGHNIIEMQYSVPWFNWGIIMSILSLIIYVIWNSKEKKYE